MKIEVETPIAPAKNKPLRKRKSKNDKSICTFRCLNYKFLFINKI